MDIYNQLIWDETLEIDNEQVLIGYTDHVLGDQEMSLLEFVPIEKGGDIPLHHIQYFRYNDVMLWDRRIRLDRIKGSGFYLCVCVFCLYFGHRFFCF